MIMLKNNHDDQNLVCVANLKVTISITAEYLHNKTLTSWFQQANTHSICQKLSKISPPGYKSKTKWWWWLILCLPTSIEDSFCSWRCSSLGLWSIFLETDGRSTCLFHNGQVDSLAGISYFCQSVSAHPLRIAVPIFCRHSWHLVIALL